MKWGSYTLTEVNKLADKTMVAYQVKNFNFGTGLLADHNEVRVKDMDESDLSGMVRYKVVYTGGVAIVRPAEVVLYN
jgi:ribosomal protein S12